MTFKKFVAPLTAVALVAAMGVSLLGSQRIAYAADSITTAGAVAVDGGLNGSNGGAKYTTAPNSTAQYAGAQGGFATTATTNSVIALDAAGDMGIGDVYTFTAPSGWFWGSNAVTATYPTTGAGTWAVSTTDNTKLTFTVSAATTAAGNITISAWPLRPLTTSSSAGSVTFTAVMAAGTSTVTSGTLASVTLTTRSTTGTVYVFPTTAGTIDAGGTNIAYLTVVALDGNLYPFTNTQINLSAGIGGFGTTGTATASATTSATTGANTGSFTYRGKGVTGTDTIVATAQGLTNVTPGTYSVTLAAPTGNTAAKTTIVTITNLAVAANQDKTSPNYISPLRGTDITLQASDASGNGVNGQLLLVSVDKGAIAAGSNACTAGTTTATTAVSAATATVGSNSGRATMSYCGNQDNLGAATVTVTNISTTGIPAVTGSLTNAGQPAKIVLTTNGNVVSATVTDKNGNPVADNTPVRWTIPTNVGSAASSCTTTSNGKASNTVVLVGSTGSVLASVDWVTSGTPASCSAIGASLPSQPATTASSGSEVISASVAITGAAPTGSSPGTTTPAPAAGAGSFAAAPVFSAAGLAQSVFNGGTVKQLADAVTAAKGTGVWAQDSKGNFVAFIIGAPDSVNAAFNAAFPNGFAGVTAVTVVGAAK